MKAQTAILVFISLLPFSCAPATPTQEDDIAEIVTEEIITEAPTTQEPITTEEPIVTEEATETSIACITLLTPTNGSEIPPVGKVTFSWTAIDEAGKYVLNIILPSGDIVPFETDQSFHEQYMEAFSIGGKYQWQVVAQGKDGSEICISDVAEFDKSPYNPPENSNNSNSGESGDNGSNDGGDGGNTCDPISGCDGGNH